MSTTLLSYAVATNPDPIQSSQPQAQPSLVTLTIVVSNNTHQLIQCKSIVFTLPVGVNAKELYSDISGIMTTAPVGWSMTQIAGGNFQAVPDTSGDGNIGGAGLVFVFSNIQVNEQPGTFALTIVENAGQQAGTTNILLAKFPPQS